MGVATYIKDEKDAIKEVILQSGIKVKPVYTPEDLERVGFDYAKDLGNAGEFPFTRSIHPSGYRSRNWTTRQYTGFGTPEETNERFKLMISHGQTGLNVAFDLPTQMGYDSDNELSEGEVGRVGMAVDSLKDFEIAFKDIQLNRIGSGLTINAVASIMLAMYQAVAEKFGYKKEEISATPQNDILKEIVGRGAWIYPVEPAVRLIGDTIEYSMKELPRCNPVSVCGYHIRESGCTPSQEISYALLIAFAYIDNVVARGYKAEDFVGSFSFNLNIYGNMWETVAKFRAARKLWATLLRERYDVQNKKALFLRGIFGGGGSGMTKQQPENNIVRGAYYALAAALSGAQTTALCSFDEAYTIPTERAALLSLRTFQILMDEIGLRDTVDPLAGSYFMETLTKEMEEKILEEMGKVEKMGGMVEAISSGYVQREVSTQAYEYEKKLQRNEVTKVGVNKYTEGADMEVELHEYNESWAQLQIDRLKILKKERDNQAVAASLKALEKA
ncbi:MAG TPA: methylmalonyl-CoA mutase, partial [Deltaproteobacteria bacterium]|nr:methylmalonyl-CoA mutase [Deltaproteobacteria bacterium]